MKFKISKLANQDKYLLMEEVNVTEGPYPPKFAWKMIAIEGADQPYLTKEELISEIEKRI